MSIQKSINASKKYCSQVSELFRRNAEIVHKYVYPNHDAVYGIQKGSASYTTIGTTFYPPISSIAYCGEQSIGKVLDTYLNFYQSSNTYLGCILGRYDLNDNSFISIPLYFIIDDLIKDEHFNEVMNLVYQE